VVAKFEPNDPRTTRSDGPPESAGGAEMVSSFIFHSRSDLSGPATTNFALTCSAFGSWIEKFRKAIRLPVIAPR